MANETKLPPVDRLKAQLLTSGLQQQNFPLYQVINQLIDALRQTISVTGVALGISGGGGGSGGILNQSYVTVDDDTATLPNSRQIVAGNNINIVDSDGTLTISASVEQSIINRIENIVNVKQAEIEITPNRRNGKVIVRDTFTEEQVGSPVFISQVPNNESEMVFVQFIGEILDTRRMRVYWMAPFGAPRKIKINYLIGV